MSCTRPDRDAPALICGYPDPCPHHTTFLGVDDVLDGSALANLRWTNCAPAIGIFYSKEFHGDARATRSEIKITAVATWENKTAWRAVRLLAFGSPMRELRDTADELLREGHLAIEALLSREGPAGKPLALFAVDALTQAAFTCRRPPEDNERFKEPCPEGKGFTLERGFQRCKHCGYPGQ